MEKKAKFKVVHNKPQLICSKCSELVKYSKDFSEEDWKAFKGEILLKPQFCDKCEEILKYK